MDERFGGLSDTHAHEEKLRAETMVLIEADVELGRRLDIIQRGMAVLFTYSLDHTPQSDNEAMAKMLGLRLFNAAASGLKLALSGYYQTAFHQARDILEVGFLLDYFRTSPQQIAVWKTADRKTRRKLYDPVQIRIALDERDGDVSKKRELNYRRLSELASHATYSGFRMTTRQGIGELGPFVDAAMLKAWLQEMVCRFGPSVVMYANQFPGAEVSLVQSFQVFGTALILGFREDD